MSKDTPAHKPEAEKLPCQRTGCRMVYIAERNALYFFGGLNITNDTLNDMWYYDIDANLWFPVDQWGSVPRPRCGHAFNLHNNTIFLFGGLIEVTHESNEVFKFDIATHTWDEIGSREVCKTPDRLVESFSHANSALKTKESKLDVHHTPISDTFRSSPKNEPLIKSSSDK